jgi:hypothetical protein
MCNHLIRLWMEIPEHFYNRAHTHTIVAFLVSA